MEKADYPYQYPKPHRSSRTFRTLIGAAFIGYIVYHLSSTVSWSGIDFLSYYGKIGHCSHQTVSASHPLAHVDSDIFSVKTKDSEPHEIFEVSFPLPDYGEPVYTKEILSHYVFGNSWGSPAISRYTPPPANITFNRVVVNISTTVSGVQYDRLAHLYLDNVPLWRTSTAEPGNRQVISNASKDLSDYLVLFQQEGQLVYQLDNIVSGRLNGEFNVTIIAAYYNYDPSEDANIVTCNLNSKFIQTIEDDEKANADEFFSQLKSIYSVLHHAPTQITPLIEDTPPLKYLPNDDFEHKISPLSRHTVAAVLRLFVSGNAAEEFWYSNVLEDNVGKFDKNGHHLLGKGPLRFVKVYLNDYLIALESPKPVIFTGGISPAFWNPTVGINAFDLGHIDVDLTAFLPLLWTRENILTVEVQTGNHYSQIKFSNIKNKIVQLMRPEGKQTDDKDNFTPDLNWIATGSLLLWENGDITSSQGLVPQAPESAKKEVDLNFGRFVPSTISQVISGTQVVSNFGILELQAKGFEKPVKFALNSTYAVSANNVQNYKQFGDREAVVSSIVNVKNFTLSRSNVTEDHKFTKVLLFTDLKEYVTTLNLNITIAQGSYDVSPSIFDLDTPIYDSKEGTFVNGAEVTIDATLVQVDSHKFKVNDKNIIRLSRSQNGTSLFYITPKGNHGSGKLQTKIKAKTGSGDVLYKRKVSTENGTVICDKLYHQ